MLYLTKLKRNGDGDRVVTKRKKMPLVRVMTDLRLFVCLEQVMMTVQSRAVLCSVAIVISD